jgi:hypothetical protein
MGLPQGWSGGYGALLALVPWLFVPALLRHRCAFLPAFLAIAVAFMDHVWQLWMWPITLAALALYALTYGVANLWSSDNDHSGVATGTSTEDNVRDAIPSELRCLCDVCAGMQSCRQKYKLLTKVIAFQMSTFARG